MEADEREEIYKRMEQEVETPGVPQKRDRSAGRKPHVGEKRTKSKQRRKKSPGLVVVDQDELTRQGTTREHEVIIIPDESDSTDPLGLRTVRTSVKRLTAAHEAKMDKDSQNVAGQSWSEITDASPVTDEYNRSIRATGTMDSDVPTPQVPVPEVPASAATLTPEQLNSLLLKTRTVVQTTSTKVTTQMATARKEYVIPPWKANYPVIWDDPVQDDYLPKVPLKILPLNNIGVPQYYRSQWNAIQQAERREHEAVKARTASAAAPAASPPVQATTSTREPWQLTEPPRSDFTPKREELPVQIEQGRKTLSVNLERGTTDEPIDISSDTNTTPTPPEMQALIDAAMVEPAPLDEEAIDYGATDALQNVDMESERETATPARQDDEMHSETHSVTSNAEKRKQVGNAKNGASPTKSPRHTPQMVAGDEQQQSQTAAVLPTTTTAAVIVAIQPHPTGTPPQQHSIGEEDGPPLPPTIPPISALAAVELPPWSVENHGLKIESQVEQLFANATEKEKYDTDKCAYVRDRPETRIKSAHRGKMLEANRSLPWKPQWGEPDLEWPPDVFNTDDWPSLDWTPQFMKDIQAPDSLLIPTRELHKPSLIIPLLPRPTIQVVFPANYVGQLLSSVQDDTRKVPDNLQPYYGSKLPRLRDPMDYGTERKEGWLTRNTSEGNEKVMKMFQEHPHQYFGCRLPRTAEQQLGMEINMEDNAGFYPEHYFEEMVTVPPFGLLAGAQTRSVMVTLGAATHQFNPLQESGTIYKDNPWNTDVRDMYITINTMIHKLIHACETDSYVERITDSGDKVLWTHIPQEVTEWLLKVSVIVNYDNTKYHDETREKDVETRGLADWFQRILTKLLESAYKMTFEVISDHDQQGIPKAKTEYLCLVLTLAIIHADTRAYWMYKGRLHMLCTAIHERTQGNLEIEKIPLDKRTPSSIYKKVNKEQFNMHSYCISP